MELNKLINCFSKLLLLQIVPIKFIKNKNHNYAYAINC